MDTLIKDIDNRQDIQRDRRQKEIDHSQENPGQGESRRPSHPQPHKGKKQESY